jgi:glycosyltransferase involved in cell wall biosynthesis
MQTIDISVVICTYNRARLLREALHHLVRQKTDDRFTYELVVVDDGSTDNTKETVDELARESEAPVRYARGKGNGYSHALNVGIAESRGEWIAFFDDDERADPDWLKELFVCATEAGAQMAGGPIVLALSDAELRGLGPRVRALRGEYPPGCGVSRLSWRPLLPGGGNRLIKRIVFDTVSVFDEAMLTGGCDRDLVLRARAAGFDNAWAPKAVVRHVVPPYRLKREHIRWSCQQGGCAFAYVDWKRWGQWKTLLACMARMGQALMVALPLLLLGCMRGNRIAVLDRKVHIWGSIAYMRSTLRLLAPTVFPQEQFFARMEFRKEREALDKTFSDTEGFREGARVGENTSGL